MFALDGTNLLLPLATSIIALGLMLLLDRELRFYAGSTIVGIGLGICTKILLFDSASVALSFGVAALYLGCGGVVLAILGSQGILIIPTVSLLCSLTAAYHDFGLSYLLLFSLGSMMMVVSRPWESPR